MNEDQIGLGANGKVLADCDVMVGREVVCKPFCDHIYGDGVVVEHGVFNWEYSVFLAVWWRRICLSGVVSRVERF